MYEKRYPDDKWDNFSNYSSGRLYKRLKKQIFQEQGELCAYCESKVEKSYKQRVEHINDKSNSTATDNLHLQWTNLIGVCLGGSDIQNRENPLFPTPANLSCDAYKGHKNISYEEILNPLETEAFPSLFKFNKRSHELEVNECKCQEAGIDTQFVKDTIVNLNLNCDRLKTARHQILIAYNREVEKGRKAKDREVMKKLANKWFSQKFPSFFTTRRDLLGKHAEEYLLRVNYNG